MIITTMCILVLKDIHRKVTAWHCDGIGYVVSRYAPYLDLELKKYYSFDVRVDENGDKVLVLRKGK